MLLQVFHPGLGGDFNSLDPNYSTDAGQGSTINGQSLIGNSQRSTVNCQGSPVYGQQLAVKGQR